MKQNQKGFGLVEILVALLVITLVIVAALHFIKTKTRVSINNEGQSFSFDIDAPAKKVIRSSQDKTVEYFQATPKGGSTILSATVYKPKSSNADLKDTCKYDKSDVTVFGKTHTLCNQKNKAYIANFDLNNTWYQIAVFPNDINSELQQSDVAKLIESIQSD